MSEKIAWKKCGAVIKDRTVPVLVKLEILGETNKQRWGVVDARYAKFRTNKARVLAVENLDGTPWLVDCVRSMYQGGRVIWYKIGEVVTPHDWEDNIDIICGGGIHFFWSREAALAYNCHMHKFPDDYSGPVTTYDDNGRPVDVIEFCNGKRRQVSASYVNASTRPTLRSWVIVAGVAVAAAWWMHNNIECACVLVQK